MIGKFKWQGDIEARVERAHRFSDRDVVHNDIFTDNKYEQVMAVLLSVILQ